VPSGLTRIADLFMVDSCVYVQLTEFRCQDEQTPVLLKDAQSHQLFAWDKNFKSPNTHTAVQKFNGANIKALHAAPAKAMKDVEPHTYFWHLYL
jgi:hypothetical protein